MNEKSTAVDTKGRPETRFNKYHLSCWFDKNRGRDKISTGEPLSVGGTETGVQWVVREREGNEEITRQEIVRVLPQ